ncbi:hypothetical protein [Anaerosporobacter sp.]|uniref:hypothetical protein n=1 Tax=Anaerosporobacter sp. TaxID=1872529 RepID=UPI00286EB82E|nr:hypothetical protein [Anaerosporobacter sp.]
MNSRNKAKNPQDILSNKYSNNTNYNVLLHREKDECVAYLGSDDENIYVDIFENGDYLGGSFLSLNDDNSINLYQTRQYHNTIVVFGDNTKTKYHSYTLIATGNHTEPLTIEQTIPDNNKILDIYLLDSKYNMNFDLEFHE